MRDLSSRGALLAACLLALLAGHSARAGITYDFAFRSTDVTGAPIVGSGVAPGGHTFSFDGPTVANACDAATGAGCPVMDVILISTVDLIGATGSVTWDTSGGLAADTNLSRYWAGQGIVFNAMNNPTVKFSNLGSLTIDNAAGQARSFGGVVPPPAGPPSLPPGTYHIGTVVWDTSGMGTYSAVMTTVLPGFDASGGPGGVIYTGTEVTNLGFITLDLIPEPATAALLALGLAALGLAGRRYRSG